MARPKAYEVQNFKDTGTGRDADDNTQQLSAGASQITIPQALYPFMTNEVQNKSSNMKFKYNYKSSNITNQPLGTHNFWSLRGALFSGPSQAGLTA